MSKVTPPPSWLDKKLMETALQTNISSYDVFNMGAGGDNYTSSLYQVVANLETGGTQSVIIKRLVDTGVAAKAIRESSMFDREIHTYNVILPKIDALLKKIIRDVEPMGPRLYYSSTGLLVMEDLNAAGFKLLDRRQGLDLDQSLLVMRMLARFHAASAVLYEKEPDVMSPFMVSLYTESCIRQNLRNFFIGMTRLLADEVAAWPEYGAPYSKKLHSLSEELQDKVVEGSRREEGAFNVLTHDDLWINNLLFLLPNSVRMIDFQMPHFSSPANDLQLFVCSSVTEEVWSKHVPTLLGEYHSTLCATLEALQYTRPLITLEELKTEYEKRSLYSFVIAVVYLPAVLCRPDYDVPMFESENVVPDRGVYDGSRYRDTIRRMLRVFEEQGAFTVEKM